MSTPLQIDTIRIDGGTQIRERISEDTVTEYAAAIEAGTEFPPLVVYHDGTDYWLADGFHRIAAFARLGRGEVPAEVRKGTRRDAILFACGANAAHGLKRTNADKRRAVMAMLTDEEWGKWGDREISRRCGVGHQLVSHVRASLDESSSEPRTYTTRHGTKAKMNTAKIGSGGSGRQSVEVRTQQIRELAESGHVASQIAGQLGVCEEYVRSLANRNSITLPDVAMGKKTKIDHLHIIRETATALEGLAMGLRFVSDDDVNRLEPGEAQSLAASISESLRPINRLRRKLAEEKQ